MNNVQRPRSAEHACVNYEWYKYHIPENYYELIHDAYNYQFQAVRAHNHDELELIVRLTQLLCEAEAALHNTRKARLKDQYEFAQEALKAEVERTLYRDEVPAISSQFTPEQWNELYKAVTIHVEHLLETQFKSMFNALNQKPQTAKAERNRVQYNDNEFRNGISDELLQRMQQSKPKPEQHKTETEPMDRYHVWGEKGRPY